MAGEEEEGEKRLAESGCDEDLPGSRSRGRSDQSGGPNLPNAEKKPRELVNWGLRTTPTTSPRLSSPGLPPYWHRGIN